MRDLKADLEGIQSGSPALYASGWPMEIVMEYLQRAIEAEANNYRADFEHYYELYEELRAENAELKRKLFDAETRYKSAVGMVENLSGQVAALREGLESYPFKHHNDVCGCPECQWLGKRVELLSSSDPGEKIMRVVEAARIVNTLWESTLQMRLPNEKPIFKGLTKTLADLEGGGR